MIDLDDAPSPTECRREDELWKLKRALRVVPEFSEFGDDHHLAIKAQMECIEIGMDEWECHNKTEWPEYARLCAVDAARWWANERFDPPSWSWTMFSTPKHNIKRK